ncbi:helix-turn-helix domain-containing protein [Actinoallomurus sp. CA-150999]|uniref:helix-turn-helix domain-containing protein n=1 Tax=Actinoallomurus sp. CA-150999 TaxID=3239887 RepID=UPI003D94EC19
MSTNLPQTTRTLLEELRALKDRSGYDLRALEGKTYASRSSWGRWLSGETWIPYSAVETMAELCGGDKQRLQALWHRADDDRRRATPDAAPQGAVPDAASPEGAAREDVPAGRVARDDTPPERVAHEDIAAEGSDAASFRRPGAPRRRRMLHIGITLGCSLAAGTVGLASGLSLRPEPARRPHPAPTVAQWITRPQILTRARTWHPHSDRRIPYDMSKNRGGYRTDGSGYASMTLGLPAPGPNSTDLAWGGYARQIPPSKLLPGDLIINATGQASTRQVAIFEKWANTAHTAYWVYQQRREYGTDHLMLRYALSANSPYRPYRPLNINEQDEPSS